MFHPFIAPGKIQAHHMKKIIVFFLLGAAGYSPLQAQLAVAKMVGKGSDNYKMGFGLFTYYDFPLNDIGNRSLRIELLDTAYFPSKPASP